MNDTNETHFLWRRVIRKLTRTIIKDISDAEDDTTNAEDTSSICICCSSDNNNNNNIETAGSFDSSSIVIVDDVVEWNDPDLLLALQSLTTKDDDDNDGDDDDSIYKQDSLPSVHIDPVDIQEEDDDDIELSFQNIFDFDDEDIKELTSMELLLPKNESNPNNNNNDNDDDDLGIYCMPCQIDLPVHVNQFIQDANIAYIDSLLQDSILFHDMQNNHPSQHAPSPPSHATPNVPEPPQSPPEQQHHPLHIHQKQHLINNHPPPPVPSNNNNNNNNNHPLLVNDMQKNERTCLGHKETIFGLAFSPCGKFIATASQDSTIGIWNAQKHVRITTLSGHNKNHECLRVSWISETKLASACADGCVKIWENDADPTTTNWNCVTTLDHGTNNNNNSQKETKTKDETKTENETKNETKTDDETKDEDDQSQVEEKAAPQIYALQFIEKWYLSHTFAKDNLLMTSSDNYIHLWQMKNNNFDKRMEINFTDLEQGFGGVFVQFISSTRSNNDTDDNENAIN